MAKISLKKLVYGASLIGTIMLAGYLLVLRGQNPFSGTSTKVSGPKDLPPLEVNLSTDKEKLSIGKDFQVDLTFTPLKGARRVSAQLGTSGVVSTISPQDFTWKDIPANKNVETFVTLRIDSLGEGEIRWVVQLVDEAGSNYQRRADLYFLATEEGVFAGTSSPMDLKIENLQRRLRSGKITQQQYDEALEKLLGGGATEVIVTIAPTP